MFPLLALGLMAGNQWLKTKRQDDKEAEAKAVLDQARDEYKQLRGESPQEMGPPDQQGVMGSTSGRGLLADPSNPQKQAEFATGIMGLRALGLESVGGQLLSQGQQRYQQGQQFDQSQRQQGEQFNRSLQQQGDQFSLNYQQHGAQLAQQAAQWLQQFKANQGETNARLGLARRAQENDDIRLMQQADEHDARLGLGPGGGRPELPKLPPGMGYTDSAMGTVAMPLPGTPQYAEVTQKDGALQGAQRRIGALIDMVEGKEETTPQGNKVRRGGMGTEYTGEQAAVYSGMRAAIIADVAKLRDMGVLQAGELENLEKQLPDPSSLGGAFTRNKTVTAAYKQLRQQFKEKGDSWRQSNPWLLPKAPPGAQVMQ